MKLFAQGHTVLCGGGDLNPGNLTLVAVPKPHTKLPVMCTSDTG